MSTLTQYRASAVKIDIASCCVLQHVVDAVLSIQQPNEPIDLHMIEITEMQHKTANDTLYVVLVTTTLCT
jgi:hypothetical protein